MKQKVFRLLTFMMVLTLVVTPVSANPITDEVETAVDSLDLTPMDVTGLQVSETGLYVVQLSDPSLARYTGGINGLAATSPAVTGASKLDVSAPASVAYLSYLQGKHSEFISQMNAALGRSVEVTFQYLNALNALAVEVSHAEAEILAELPDVVVVYADSLREIETDVGPILIGAPAFWEGDHQIFAFFSVLSGDNEVPPVPSDASGEGTFTYDPTTNELTWEISHDLEMEDVTAAHIHVGAVGVNGPPIITLDHTENPMVGSEILTDEQQGWLMNHLLYVNVHTTAYPGGEIRDQLWTEGHRGEGVIVGMLDTGVNPFHLSFAAEDGDGYIHENPFGSGNFVGVCDPADPDYDDICNDKLIGAWNFHPSAPNARDWNNHGSHVGSTIAGNRHEATFTVGSDVFTRTISGVAPRANVISYLVCFPSCPETSSVAAVDQAIADGVDVLNYSISGTDNPWNDMVDLAFLDAFAAGMFVSASAGNDGPGSGTVAKTGPWNAAVAASTHNRVIANTVDVTAPTQPPELQGMAAVPGTGPAITADIVAEIRWSEDVDPGNIRGCDPFPAGAFSGAIALIQRGDCTFELKVTNATTAGAIAAIIYNHVGGPPIVMGGLEGTTIESVFIDKNDGDALAAFISASVDPVEARINEATSVIVNDAWQDVIAGFSSRGPSQFDLLKPDYTAPGVNILAAGFDSPNAYVFLQGTSMSSPHSAGAAALMVDRHPDWTPAEVKSALAMTAWQDVLHDDGVTQAGFFDMGSGRIDLTQGALIGLVMDETFENYVDANPDIGGDPKTLNQPSMVDQNCVEECSWTRTLRSVLDVPATYNVITEAPAGMTITVIPDSFTIAAGDIQELEINVSVDLDVLPAGDWAFAQIHLETGSQPMIAQYGDFVELGESYDHDTAWAEKTHDISSYEGQDVCLAFVYEAVDGHTWFIDDILVTSDLGVHLDESFTDETFPPDGWSIYELGSNPHRQWARTTSNPNTPPAAAWHDWTFSSNHDDNWLVTPQFTLGDNAEFTYYDRMGFITWYNYSGVWISTGSCDPTPVFETDVAPVKLPIAVIPTLDVPIITVDPDEMSATQAPGEVTTQTLTIGNEGFVDLNWMIAEAEPLAVAAGDETASTVPFRPDEAAMDLVSELGMPLPAGLSPIMPSDVLVVDCEVEPGIIIHDDGTIENGYSGNPDVVNQVIFVDPFTPSSYPASFTAVCVSLVSLGTTSLDFDIVLYADDGPGGAPGTELGSLPVSASDIPIWPAPVPMWNAYDISALEVSIDAGSVYIGVRYAPPSPNVFIAADESTTTPLTGGYWWNDNAGVWAPIQTAFADYRALFVRAVAEVPPSACESPTDVPWLSVEPDSGTTSPGGSDEVTVTFDSTSVEPGVYDAFLCVISDDPVNPLVEVPVTLEVLGDFPSIEVDPEALESSQASDTQVTLPLDILNTGTADLIWNIEEADGIGEPLVIEPLNLPVGTDRANQADTPLAGSAPGQVLPTGQGQLLSSWSEGFDDINALPALGWAMINNSDPLGLTDWFQGNPDVFPAHSGDPDSYIGANFNNTAGVGTISNWLLTPEITMNDGDSFTFYTNSPASAWEDRLQVRLSTNGDSTDVGSGAFDVGDFDTLLLDINPDYAPGGYPTVWTQFEITLSDLGGSVNGRLAFRYFVENGGPAGTNSDYIGIDTFEYTALNVCDVPGDVSWLSVSPDSGVTAPGEMDQVDVTFDSTGLDIGEYSAYLCVFSNDPMNPEIVVPVMLAVVEAEYGLELAPEADALSGDPSETVEYTLTLTNTGNSSDTFEITFDGNDWDVNLPVTSFDLEAGAFAEVTVHVTVPADAMAGDFDVVTITATSAGDPELSADSVLTTTANTVYALMLAPEADALSADPGETVEYTLTLTNSGNTSDTFEITFDGNDWDVHLPETSFELAAGASADVIVHVTIPAEAEDGNADMVTITATSAGDEDVSASSTLTTTAEVSEPDVFYLFTPIVNKN